MVDINLIGDDKTGEEERVDDFTQTTSMDTQELAFEERTETFDTTKTAGFAQKRSYSSLVSTLIIVVVIVLLGGAAYFFLNRGDDSQGQATQRNITPPPAQEQSQQVSDAELAELEQAFSDELANTNFDQQQVVDEAPIEVLDEPVIQQQTPVTQQQFTPKPQRTIPNTTRNLETVSSDFLANSKTAIQSVTNLLTSVPANLNITLLSYTGQRARVEFVAATTADARDFTSKMNQYFGAGNFVIVSESQVNANGRILEKVLVTGKINSASNGSGGSARFLNTGQAKDWIRRNAQQYNLVVRELKSQPGSYSGGYQKIPLLVRVYGSQSALIGFLEEFSSQSINVEMAKILLVSPDMATFSDETMILVLNMYLHEKA